MAGDDEYDDVCKGFVGEKNKTEEKKIWRRVLWKRDKKEIEGKWKERKAGEGGREEGGRRGREEKKIQFITKLKIFFF